MANSLPTSSARASLGPVLILGLQWLFCPLGYLALSFHKRRCHGQTGRRWEGWKSLISGWQKQGLAYDEQTWWCSGVPALCSGTAWDSMETVMRKGPGMNRATNQQGRLMRHHGLGLVHAQPHKQGL